MIHELQNNDVHNTYFFILYFNRKKSQTYCALIEIYKCRENRDRQIPFFLLLSKCLIITGNEAHQVARTILNSFTYIQSIIVIELKNRVIVTMCLLERQRTSEVVYHETRH
jgi:hypothetical protein